MPILPLQPMESVYENGYYVNSSTDEQANIQRPLFELAQTVNVSDILVVGGETNQNQQYCVVHGCDVTNENSNTLKNHWKLHHQK